MSQGDLVVVTKGLSVGDRVVVDGQNQLRPGARIVARPFGSAEGKPSGTPSGKPSGKHP
ncbi:MAG: hypothetical protein IPJ34_02105 [Myxococcales bacterium]|nr:hypothetical protein [Myxococcales bacterium]